MRVGPRGVPSFAALAISKATSDGGLLALAAFVVRCLVVYWAKDRFSPADDGSFYHVVAGRIAQGAGYTWRWPDGVVSYAAHYPVGYPALLGAAYALFGARPVVAMVVNAGLGALAAFAAERAAARYGSRRQALLAGGLVAFHPGLVFYTPALMTEGVSAELAVIAAWLMSRVGSGPRTAARLTALGACGGLMTLIRPQLLIMAPVFGFLSWPTSSANTQWRARLLRASLVLVVAVGACLPWTLRNCVRMDRCTFVSANGGWNLLIGSAPEADGSWMPIEGSNVPVECRTVFAEVAKDQCFARAGISRIARAPLAFLARVPRKLSLTFDYFGAPGHYLHTSNAREFDDTRKVELGVLETIWERAVLLLALAAVAREALASKTRRKLRLVMAAFSWLFALFRFGYVGYLGYVVTVALSGKELLKQPLTACAAALVASTALTHALFFGAGRYGFVCVALLSVAAGGAAARFPRAPHA